MHGNAESVDDRRPREAAGVAEAIRRSLDLRVQEFLRPRLVHVGLGDQVGAGVDEGLDLLALGGGERGLDAVIAHAEGILHDEGGHHAVLERP